jgi:hypothetical protein
MMVLLSRSVFVVLRASSPASRYSSARRNLRALLMTDTELNVIAVAAMIGLSSRPKTG